VRRASAREPWNNPRMGMMVDGVWRDVWYDTRASGGAFVRP
jgi:hypothetical protein